MMQIIYMFIWLIGSTFFLIYSLCKLVEKLMRKEDWLNSALLAAIALSIVIVVSAAVYSIK